MEGSEVSLQGRGGSALQLQQRQEGVRLDRQQGVLEMRVPLCSEQEEKRRTQGSQETRNLRKTPVNSPQLCQTQMTWGNSGRMRGEWFYTKKKEDLG